jgi:hypothetical protein
MEGTLFGVWMIIVGAVVIASVPLSYIHERNLLEVREREMELRRETKSEERPVRQRSVRRRWGIPDPSVDTDSEEFRKKYRRHE